MVALASILAMDAPVLIFDEPTTGQDATSIQRIDQIVDFLVERGKTIITITHEIDFVADHFERAIAMSKRQILLDGLTLGVIADEEQLAPTSVPTSTYPLGTPARNTLYSLYPGQLS